MDKFKNYIKLNIGLARKQMLFCLAWFGIGNFIIMLVTDSLPPMANTMWLLVGMVFVVIVCLKLFDEMLFGDGSGLYQALPVSAGQVVVAKLSIVMCLGILSWIAMCIGSAGAYFIGKYILGGEIIYMPMSELFGIGVTLYIYINLIMKLFMAVSMVLAGIAIQKTFLEDKNSFIGTAIIAAIVILIITGINKLSSIVGESLAETNQLLSMVIVVSLNLFVGLVACFIAKRQLETAYVAE